VVMKGTERGEGLSFGADRVTWGPKATTSDCRRLADKYGAGWGLDDVASGMTGGVTSTAPRHVKLTL
jgi:hypothetical protein